MSIFQIHGLSKMRLAFPAIPALPCHEVASAPLFKPMRRHTSAFSLSPAPLPRSKTRATGGGLSGSGYHPHSAAAGRGPRSQATTARHRRALFGASPHFRESVRPSPHPVWSWSCSGLERAHSYRIVHWQFSHRRTSGCNVSLICNSIFFFFSAATRCQGSPKKNRELLILLRRKQYIYG